MRVEEIEVEDMVRIVLTTAVGLLVGELAFLEVAEEAIVGHHVSWIVGAFNGFELIKVRVGHQILIIGSIERKK